ncbi:YrhB family protein [Streptomyces sp. NPDC018019]|uniref:YrhB family protein n=1 Tax=Streptomyces sp. NPDC018019 TaxID=3365030 RepID=UPI00378A4EDC
MAFGARIHWSYKGPVRNAAHVIERKTAVQAVEEQLERDYREWRDVGVDPVRMAVLGVEEHELVWIVSWQSEEYVRTRNPEFMLVGNGPYLVDRVDGGLHQVSVVSAVSGEWEADYRARIRGLPVRTVVDDLHGQRPDGWLESQSACRSRIRSRSSGVASKTSAPPS